MYVSMYACMSVCLSVWLLTVCLYHLVLGDGHSVGLPARVVGVVDDGLGGRGLRHSSLSIDRVDASQHLRRSTRTHGQIKGQSEKDVCASMAVPSPPPLPLPPYPQTWGRAALGFISTQSPPSYSWYSPCKNTVRPCGIRTTNKCVTTHVVNIYCMYMYLC